jgi:hypothetical protein
MNTNNPLKDVSLEVSKKLGKDLIREALTKRIDAQKAQVVGQVNLCMERLSVMQRLQEKTDKRVQFLKDQLAAINSGEFSIHDRTGEIIFKNEFLNTTWDQTERF